MLHARECTSVPELWPYPPPLAQPTLIGSACLCWLSALQIEMLSLLRTISVRHEDGCARRSWMMAGWMCAINQLVVQCGCVLNGEVAPVCSMVGTLSSVRGGGGPTCSAYLYMILILVLHVALSSCLSCRLWTASTHRADNDGTVVCMVGRAYSISSATVFTDPQPRTVINVGPDGCGCAPTRLPPSASAATTEWRTRAVLVAIYRDLECSQPFAMAFGGCCIGPGTSTPTTSASRVACSTPSCPFFSCKAVACLNIYSLGLRQAFH